MFARFFQSNLCDANLLINCQPLSRLCRFEERESARISMHPTMHFASQFRAKIAIRISTLHFAERLASRRTFLLLQIVSRRNGPVMIPTLASRKSLTSHDAISFLPHRIFSTVDREESAHRSANGLNDSATDVSIDEITNAKLRAHSLTPVYPAYILRPVFKPVTSSVQTERCTPIYAIQDVTLVEIG
ncbi:PREDICTED: uncharacterized protein LOC106750287 [Dinoponera quadriceps]|uniref:Uncharacterized protein LOC106750287 n=1 Tax=Dinoponera quadriceps TaxID=609295 RepID=A0A6P3Y562_DINQU|nr:PREDICTED: uncharacterized protein LOC106750287 [Dinoponera quadriceps]